MNAVHAFRKSSSTLVPLQESSAWPVKRNSSNRKVGAGWGVSSKLVPIPRVCLYCCWITRELNCLTMHFGSVIPNFPYQKMLSQAASQFRGNWSVEMAVILSKASWQKWSSVPFGAFHFSSIRQHFRKNCRRNLKNLSVLFSVSAKFSWTSNHPTLSWYCLKSGSHKHRFTLFLGSTESRTRAYGFSASEIEPANQVLSASANLCHGGHNHVQKTSSSMAGRNLGQTEPLCAHYWLWAFSCPGLFFSLPVFPDTAWSSPTGGNMGITTPGASCTETLQE